MKPSAFRRHASTIVSLALLLAIFTAPLRAQQPVSPPPAPAQVESTFDTLLSADSYKLYVEVRNVGTLLTTGGAGEIIDPILKLSDPGPQLTALVKFLKENAEPLAASRLMIATWPARTDIPSTMAAVEFATPQEAAKFAPKLETFLPTIMPPVPVESPEASPSPSPVNAEPQTEAAAAAGPAHPGNQQTRIAAPPAPQASATPKREMRSPFVLKQSGSLVFITDRAFKPEKLHPRDSLLLSEDKNFRVARDRFSSEPVFLFFNVALEDKTVPRPSPTPVVSDEERQREELEKEAERQRIEAEASLPKTADDVEPNVTSETAVLSAGPAASPTPTPTKEQEAQRIASNQIGSLLGMLGQGQPQWPEAVGVALALTNDEYVARAILIEKENARVLPLPFVPQLLSGPAMNSEAAAIVPDDTEILISASIDFAGTYHELKKQAEANFKQSRQIATSSTTENPLDSFAQFEKKSGLKITEDLLPVLGSELAVGASLNQANMANMVGLPTPPAKTSSEAKDKHKPDPWPMFLIAIKDREAARRLIPKVMEGLGIGEANMLAQHERRGNAEIVNYAGIFSYAFIGNFLVVSDSETVRKAADAHINGTTLSVNNSFRAARHWQPRQTLGEIYVSPALMEGYQEQIGKQAASMDQAMRDFLMKLSPKASAITYSLSHEGLGSVHELHLPKNLILTMVAGTSAAMTAMKEGSPEMNEMIAISVLQLIARGEENYKTTAGNGTYGGVDELVEHKMLAKDVLNNYGYKFQITTNPQGFEVMATPVEYGKSGRRSFFIDQSGVVRGGDHGGGPATIADSPVDH